jgi:molybdate transport system ATP-binding protein
MTGSAVIDAHVRRHVVDAELVVPDGTTVTVLFGPSGSGKTTILRCLAGLDRLEAGHVRVRGDLWNDGARSLVPARRRRIGYLFQDHALFPHLSVTANVAYGLGDVPRGDRPARVTQALEAAHAGHLADRPVRQLSGGEAQRVALARAIAPQPDLLLLDEPLSALDAGTRASLRSELRRILVEQGIPTILVTHDRTEALSLGDRIVLLVDGRVRQEGAPADVFDRPTDPAVAAVVGVETTHPAVVVSTDAGVARLDIGGRQVAAAVPEPAEVRSGDQVLACIRAEDVSIQLGHTDAISSQRNQLDATVRAITAEGPLVRVDLDAGFPLASYITRPAREDLGLEPGRTVVAVFKGQAVHLIPRGRPPQARPH